MFYSRDISVSISTTILLKCPPFSLILHPYFLKILQKNNIYHTLVLWSLLLRFLSIIQGNIMLPYITGNYNFMYRLFHILRIHLWSSWALSKRYWCKWPIDKFINPPGDRNSLNVSKVCQAWTQMSKSVAACCYENI